MEEFDYFDFSRTLISNIHRVDNQLLSILDTISTFLKTDICSIWTINSNPANDFKSVSLRARKVRDGLKAFNSERDFVHELTDKCFSQKVMDESASKKFIRFKDFNDNISADNLYCNDIRNCIAVPIHDYNNRSLISAILFIYNRDEIVCDFNKIAIELDDTISLSLETQNLTKKRNLINKLVENYRLHGGEHDIHALFSPIINKIIREFIPCEGISFFYLDRDNNRFILNSSTPILDHESKDYKDLCYEIGEGLTGIAAVRKQPCIINDIGKAKESIHLGKIKNLTKHKGKSLLIFPILRPTDSSEVIGIIRLVNKVNEVNSDVIDYFNSLDVELMKFACHHMALCIDTYLNEDETRTKIYTLAHEFRAPATSIKGTASIIPYSYSDQSICDAKLLSKINDIYLLSVAQLSFVDDCIFAYNNEKQYKIEKTDFLKILVQSKKAVIPIARNASVSFDNIIINNIPKFPIYVDEEKFVSIFRNLFTNAIKYRNKEKDFWVEVNVIERKDSIDVYVEDIGMGISQKDAQMVFQKYYRSEEARKASTTGLGLGLFIINTILADFGGTIEIDKFRDPTRFHISLPIEIKNNNIQYYGKSK